MVTALRLVRTPHSHFETRLQTILEQYLRLLRERIPAVIELKGALPANFWVQEEKALAKWLLTVEGAEIRNRDLAQKIIAATAPRVNELLMMESQREISVDMLRYELRIGPLGDARAERLAVQQASYTAEISMF